MKFLHSHPKVANVECLPRRKHWCEAKLRQQDASTTICRCGMAVARRTRAKILAELYIRLREHITVLIIRGDLICRSRKSYSSGSLVRKGRRPQLRDKASAASAIDAVMTIDNVVVTRPRRDIFRRTSPPTRLFSTYMSHGTQGTFPSVSKTKSLL